MIHPIPANDTKDEPEHWHIDFRFLFRTDAEVGPLQTEEVTDAAWREIDSISGRPPPPADRQALR
ncbi:hypothetical protein QMK19_04470 [Streptomyces sp. H10-C2]|uniref:hypothetical protein n=1 Tax=unclassified Streptomyces TaxID=2593676 RepID=UPI0024B8F493|nr:MULTISPECIES: hypothetical protein [unclassified Streptomyces]MDJ0341736.1 hypothetical protein [Streptomyces sp. PH10-H1]MDJ0368956.1 hypothetical protein [Streptomyces sp. H10-C2]